MHAAGRHAAATTHTDGRRTPSATGISQGRSPGWASCPGTWPARSGRSTGGGTSPSSASSPCRCCSPPWSPCPGSTTTGTTGRTCSPPEFSVGVGRIASPWAWVGLPFLVSGQLFCVITPSLVVTTLHLQDWWLLPSAICSSSHHHLANKVNQTSTTPYLFSS